MSKLHELLAVESNLDGQATKARSDLADTFAKKRHLFGSKIQTFSPYAEGAASSTEEQSDIQTTISKELQWVSGIMAKAMDVSYQIDVANTVAQADIVLEDDTVVARDVPPTALMALEKSIKHVHDLALAIPTLDPAKGFREDEQKGAGIYQAREVTAVRSKKVKKVLELAPATEKHPAQVQVYDADDPVGVLKTQEWSSLITPAQKSDILDRCDMLLRAIRKAKARANEQDLDVTGNKIGRALLNYVFGA